MATKAEKAKAEEAKKGTKPKRARKLARRKSTTEKHKHHEPIRAGERATYAEEPARAKGKRPSRKSTRKGANHERGDTNLTLRSERAKSAPTDKARAAKRKATTTGGASKSAEGERDSFDVEEGGLVALHPSAALLVDACTVEEQQARTRTRLP